MKKSLGMMLMLVCLTLPVIVEAQNTDIIDEVEKLDESDQVGVIKELDQSLAFETFSSCEDMKGVLNEFIKDNQDSFGGGWGRGGGWGGPMILDSMDMIASDGAASPAMQEKSSIESSSNDISTTNIQVGGVDEPDILKTNGEYLFYYNQKNYEVSILKSPLDRLSSTIDLDALEVVSTIKIPESFYGVQLFINANRLVIIGSRWKETNYYEYQLLDNSSRVDVVIYDVSDPKRPTMERFTDLDGSYTDARLIDNKLYVISQLSINWWNAWRVYDDKNLDLQIDDVLPTSIDIAYKKKGDKNLTIGGKEYPYGINTVKSDCNDILYVLPTSESLKESGLMPSFTVVREIDISSPQEDVDTTTAFGSTNSIHMSNSSLYLANGLWVPYSFSCPINAKCIMPWFWGGEQHTLLHKFSVQSNGLSYDASTVIPGQPLTQYSMSEDASGNFRILTQEWNPKTATHFFVLDKDLSMGGSIMNIEPGEEFKSSRYIGNKLYLVTFEQTDPLFVIDIADIKNPTIIGELKIPGYSTYLHPYGLATNGVQNLIGIGYDTVPTQWGGVQNAGVKIDLYTIDYNKKDSEGMVSVKQTHTKTFGGKGSWSEALENPRMFVWNEKEKLLIMPIILQEEETGKNCSIEYDNAGNEISKNCWDSERYKTTFAGMKGFSIDITNGIDEDFSFDYADELKKNSEYSDYELYPWLFREANFRVGYLGDLIYGINTMFGHFVVPGTDVEKILEF